MAQKIIAQRYREGGLGRGIVSSRRPLTISPRGFFPEVLI